MQHKRENYHDHFEGSGHGDKNQDHGLDKEITIIVNGRDGNETNRT